MTDDAKGNVMILISTGLLAVLGVVNRNAMKGKA